MRRLLAAGLVVALGGLVAPVGAEDMAWRAVTSRSSVPPAAWKPQLSPDDGRIVSPLGLPGGSNGSPATLGRPVPLPACATGAPCNPTVTPIGFRTRAEEISGPMAQPLPPGPKLGDDNPKFEDIPVKPTPIQPRPRTGSSGFFSEDWPRTDDCFINDDACPGTAGCVMGDACLSDCCCYSRGRIWFGVEYLLWQTKHETVPLVAGTAVPGATRSGERLTLGFWLPFYDSLGVETSYFFLGRRSSNFGASSYLWGIELNARQKLWSGPGFWIDCIGGFRHLQLTDTINNSGAGTRNQFYGSQLGIEGEYHFWSRMFVGSAFKLALGNMHEVINGSPQNQFAVVPEFQLKLGCDITQRLRFFMGYNFLYASSVVRAGDQVANFGKHTDFWAQGVNFGLEFRY